MHRFMKFKLPVRKMNIARDCGHVVKVRYFQCIALFRFISIGDLSWLSEQVCQYCKQCDSQSEDTQLESRALRKLWFYSIPQCKRLW